MKVKEATFVFRGWVFIFGPLRYETPHWSDRKYTVWRINVFKGPKRVFIGYHDYLAFAPSAKTCRIIIKHYYRKPMTKKRIKRIVQNFK